MLKAERKDDDQIMIEQCIKGNSLAQKKLYDKYSQAMYHTIIRMLPFPNEAEDILQDTFIKVFRKIESYRGQATLGAWIKKICINTTLKYLRKQSPIAYGIEEENLNYVESTKTELRYSVNTIHEEIKKLPKGSRVVLNLYLFEGYTHKEISACLNISESTSKSQYQRGRILLQNQLKSLQHERG